MVVWKVGKKVLTWEAAMAVKKGPKMAAMKAVTKVIVTVARKVV